MRSSLCRWRPLVALFTSLTTVTAIPQLPPFSSPLIPTSTTSPASSSTVSVTTPAPYYNITYIDTSPQIFFGEGDVCSGLSCTPNPWNPWDASSFLDPKTSSEVTFHSVNQVAAKQSLAVPYVSFQFAGSAVYLYTVTTPSSVGAFNITVDGGVTWETVRPNITSPTDVADQLTWYRRGLNPNRTSNLSLRFWSDAPGVATGAGVVGLGPELNIQSFVVTQAASGDGTTSTATDNGPEVPSSSAGTPTPSIAPAVASIPPSYYSAQNRTALIVGLSIGIPLFLILLVLLALLLLCLRRRHFRGSPRDSLISAYLARRQSRKTSQNIGILDHRSNVDLVGESSPPTPSNYPGYAVGNEPGRLLEPREPTMSETGAVEPFVTGLGSMRRAERRAAAISMPPADISAEDHRLASLSSGRGGSSGEQGGSSQSETSSLYEQETQEIIVAPSDSLLTPTTLLTPTKPDQRHSAASFPLRSPTGTDRPRFHSGIPTPDGPPSPRVLPPAKAPPPIKIPPTPDQTNYGEGSTQVASFNLQKEVEARLSVVNPSTEDHHAYIIPTPRTVSPSHHEGESYRHLRLGPTPDGGQSPIASSPEPMPRYWLGSDRRSVPNTTGSDIPRSLSQVAITAAGMGTKFGSSLGLASPGSAVDMSGSLLPLPPRGLIRSRTRPGLSPDDDDSSFGSPMGDHSLPHDLHHASSYGFSNGSPSPRRTRARTLSAPSPGDAARLGLNDSAGHPKPPPYSPSPTRV